MSRMTTRRKRRKARTRENPLGLPGAAVKSRPKQPRAANGWFERPEDDPRVVVVGARTRRGAADPADTLAATDMGLCIMALTQGRDRDALREAWQSISAAHRNYRLRYVGQTGEPQGAAIAMVPDRVETDLSLRVDLRTGPERDEAAKRAWGGWVARIAALPTPQHRWALRGALMGFLGDGALWRDGSPTPSGGLAVAALRMLIDRRAALP